MERVVYPEHIFYYSFTAPSTSCQVEEFLEERRSFDLLDFPEDGRAVYLLENEEAVLKYNRLNHWKKRVKKHFGLPNGFGEYCLSNEFVNLRRLAGSRLVPRVYGFGHQRRGLLRDEYLLIEFLAGAITVDEFMQKNPDALDDVLLSVVRLFFNMLDDGFVHMDPHPKNILLNEMGEACFIDFECCSFDVSDRDFAMAFCLGYFYHFWFRRFVDEKCYDHVVLGSLKIFDFKPDNIFLAVYQRFKDAKVSRKIRYACLSSRRHRKRFSNSCYTAPEVLQRLRYCAGVAEGEL